jgi:hypothetical protein
MIKLRPFGAGLRIQKILCVLVLIACHSTATLGANDITGKARNQSRGQLAAGDDVILLRLDAGMREEARTKTDEQGGFTFAVQHPGKPYLVRVIHQGVSYDQQASAGGTLTIAVFDATRHVRGITGSIEILRAGSNGKLLHVSDLYELKNESSPPLTQAGERTFEVYLPADAKIDSVLAASPGKIGEIISAEPVHGEPGHYAVSFPLQPGATKFAFNYDLPYSGHAAFRTRHAYPLQQFAVMIPPSMKFSSRSSSFEILATGNNRYQVRAANELKAGEGPGFEVSGAGAVPALGDRTKSRAQVQWPTVANPIVLAPNRATLSALANIDARLKPTTQDSQALVLYGLNSVLLAGCAILVWRARRARKFARNVSGAQTVAPGVRQGNRPAA